MSDKVPVVMKNATGSYYFSGYWDDCKASYVSRLETRVVWHAYGCMTLPAGMFISILPKLCLQGCD